LGVTRVTPTGDNLEASAMLSVTIALDSLDATEALGRRLGGLLFPGAVVALAGPLGAGKTYLVRAVAEGARVDNPRLVSSPTFVLIQEYPGPLPVYHFDAYRLKSDAEFLELGAHEYFDGDGVCLIEWADRVERALPPARLTVRLDVTGEDTRQATVEATGAVYEKLIRELG
jgi:tRNA threonylcarbamoyladenosine biosynthesis protein TsaE